MDKRGEGGGKKFCSAERGARAVTDNQRTRKQGERGGEGEEKKRRGRGRRKGSDTANPIAVIQHPP